MTEQNLRSSLLGKIAAYTEILAKDQKSTIFVSLGEAYRKIGMLSDARHVIEKGIKQHPDSSPAYVVLARALCQQGNYQESATAFEKALSLDKESLAALVGYSRLNILMGNDAKARELLLTGRQLSPADPVINKLLLSLPVESVTIEEDEHAQEEPVEAGQPPFASATLAELYLKQGLEKQALDIYRQLAVKDPNNLVLRRQIRDLEERVSGEDTNEGPEKIVPEDKETEDLGSGTEIISETVEEQQTLADIQISGKSAKLVEPEPTVIADDGYILDRLNRWLNSIQQRRSDV